MPPSRDEIVGQIQAELSRAADKWGGSTRDDRLDRLTWLKLVDEHRIRATRHGTGADDYRHELVVIAALAIAAIEAHDRRKDCPASLDLSVRESRGTMAFAAKDDPNCRHRSHFECAQCRRMFCACCGEELAEASDVLKTLNYRCPGCAKER